MIVCKLKKASMRHDNASTPNLRMSLTLLIGLVIVSFCERNKTLLPVSRILMLLVQGDQKLAYLISPSNPLLMH